MKVFAKSIRDYFDFDEGEKILPADGGESPYEISTVTTELFFDVVEQEWTLNVAVYGYRLTAKGTRDKRQANTQVYGLLHLLDRQKFVAEMADKALAQNSMSRENVPASAYLFKGV